MNQILVIDDNIGIATALEVLFSLYEIQTLHANSPQQRLILLQSHNIDLVIQDMNFTEDTTSGEEGRTLFKQIHQQYPDLPVILLTAWENIETAVDLVKAGACDYLTKPWDDTKLVTTVKNLIELGQLRQQTNSMLSQKSSLAKSLAEQYDLCGTIFNSQAMLQTMTMATQIAHADIPVLITGPNGCGKEKVAETIQANSSVKQKPFVKVNVGALPIELLEAELFGAEAGAFTGAQKKRVGRFEAADGGTLFLDEIGNLPLSGQIKLLRVIQIETWSFLSSLRQIKNFNLDCKKNAANIYCDPAQIQQVIINLIKNAHESGSAEVDISLSIKVATDSFEIQIKDRGKGMSETNLSNALLPFYSTKSEGTGLGLPLCREIVEAHGGKILIGNRYKGGLKVTIIFPNFPLNKGK